MKRIATTAASLILAFSAFLAAAQESFPSRLVTVVNPNSPGGTADIVTRGMTEPLQRAFRQSVITVNRPGADGAVAGEADFREHAGGIRPGFRRRPSDRHRW